MDREIRLGFDDLSITKALFTWNGENNTESVGYEIIKKKKKLQYPRQLVGVRYCGVFFCQEITSDFRVKEIIIISPWHVNTGLASGEE